ncbi:MAG: hypothetical protein ACRED1_14715 [Limisphaerales bacterium]
MAERRTDARTRKGPSDRTTALDATLDEYLAGSGCELRMLDSEGAEQSDILAAGAPSGMRLEAASLPHRADAASESGSWAGASRVGPAALSESIFPGVSDGMASAACAGCSDVRGFFDEPNLGK